jgi:hypothetical protein
MIAGIHDNNTFNNYEHAEIATNSNQRAIETVQYINAINEYIYKHPEILNVSGETVLNATQIGMVPINEMSNVIYNRRVFVWQAQEVGLMSALKAQTISSALIGVITNRQFITSGKTMSIAVPSKIPNDSIVYLN